MSATEQRGRSRLGEEPLSPSREHRAVATPVFETTAPPPHPLLRDEVEAASIPATTVRTLSGRYAFSADGRTEALPGEKWEVNNRQSAAEVDAPQLLTVGSKR